MSDFRRTLRRLAGIHDRVNSAYDLGPTQERPLLDRTVTHAARYLEQLSTAPVAATATLAELRGALDKPLPESGLSVQQVIDDLVHDVEGGIVGSAGGRFFGWVIGGGHPAALAADWLTSTWDQNAALYACGPAEAVIEEVAATWFRGLLGLPEDTSVAFTTGTQMSHTTALAAARGRLLADRGWDVERDGLFGAPALRVLGGGQHHGSVERAVRLLGLGTAALHDVGTDHGGRIDLARLERALRVDPDTPTVVCLQAGEINTGAFDAFEPACRLAHQYGAWVHVDGAFGLWAAVSPQYAHLTEGIDLADSWTTDGHKWLNVPFDSGLTFVRDRAAHHAAMTVRASYLVTAADIAEHSEQQAARDQIDWNPEWSRRGRGVPIYAVIRALGREGIRSLVERCCEHAHRLVTEIAALPDVQLLAEPEINQGLVRILAEDGDHDRRTDEVIARVQASGQAWFGATTWNGTRAMRVSVVNWRTNERDVDLAVEAVRQALEARAPSRA